MVGLIYIPFPIEHRDMAANAQGFLQGSLIMSAVGFLLTGSINTSTKKPDQKITTEVTPTSTTVTTENPPLTENKDGKEI